MAMATQALSIPLDITWQRLAYSRDMVDTDFGSVDFPRKWRSSLALYAYLVPEEQTAEAYPDGRILYLRLTCSITGWNPNEELREEVDLDAASDQLDDLQRSTWEAIQSDGWANTYWPCLGAIAQVAIYPGPSDTNVGVDDFPYIIDFEPKKRELYETATDTGEFLSASSESVSVQKGTTTLDHTEKSAKVGVSYGPASASGEIKKSTDITTVDTRTTDTAREGRETQSFTTTFSQMYQLFTGYHLGTNRALFYILPRPHTTSDETSWVDANLIDGERKLEGIQDMFLVVHLPRSLGGVCVQSNLDTGHDVEDEPGRTYLAARVDDPPTHENGRGGSHGGGRGGGGGGGGGDDDDEVVRRLVVTRRVVRSCARFEDDGGLVPVRENQPPGPSHPPIVFEAALAESTTHAVLQRRGPTIRPDEQADLVNTLNGYQRRVGNVMLSGYSAGRYRSRRFVETATFQRLAARSMVATPTSVATLAKSGVLSTDLVRGLRRLKIGSVSELFGYDMTDLATTEREMIGRARDRAIQAATEVPRSRSDS